MDLCFILKLEITLFYLLSFVFICCTTPCLSLTLIVICCHSSSLDLSLVVICCHSLSLVVLLIVIRCTTRCHSLYHSLPLNVPLAGIFISDCNESRCIFIEALCYLVIWKPLKIEKLHML